MTAERAPTTLQKIANALGVSVEYFLDSRLEGETSEGMDTQLQIAELLEAFVNIADAQVRRECIEYVRGRQPNASS